MTLKMMPSKLVRICLTCIWTRFFGWKPGMEEWQSRFWIEARIEVLDRSKDRGSGSKQGSRFQMIRWSCRLA
jgi:hypothetical protein